ncbi:MAG: response regulator [bacterium]
MKILLVDDSIVYRKGVHKMLGKLLKDAVFVEAENGKVALNLIKEHNPDFIILDLLMPVMTGQEMLKILKKENSNVKVIVMSSDVQTPVKEEVKQLGAFNFINKPLTPDKAAILANLLKGES